MSSEEHPLSKAFSGELDKLAKSRADSKKDPDEVKDDCEESSEGDCEETPPDSDKEFVVDLNNVADVLVILVGKYSRLGKLLYACIVLLLIGIGLIVKAGFEIDYLQVSQRELLEELRQAKDEVERTGEKVDEAKDEVEQTKEQVKEVAESTPRVVVDADAGTAKIVIPKCKRKDCEDPPKVEPSKGPKSGGSKKPSPDKPPAPPPTQQTVPLNPTVGVDDF